MHPLDRPVWTSLNSHHNALAQGDALAKRYERGVNLFASAANDSAESLAALASLVEVGERIFVLQVPPIVPPPQLEVLKAAQGVQMICTRKLDPALASNSFSELSHHDATDMLALAKLTEPGPFLERTQQMGRFVGIRQHGQLVAMAGERFRQPGFTEVSGVCTHPDFRGQGFARALSAHVTATIQTRGEVAYLHAWKSNVAAIALYESLGFELRNEVNVAVLTRPHEVAPHPSRS